METNQLSHTLIPQAGSLFLGGRFPASCQLQASLRSSPFGGSLPHPSTPSSTVSEETVRGATSSPVPPLSASLAPAVLQEGGLPVFLDCKSRSPSKPKRSHITIAMLSSPAQHVVLKCLLTFDGHICETVKTTFWNQRELYDA